jgi:hypothetical protein
MTKKLITTGAAAAAAAVLAIGGYLVGTGQSDSAATSANTTNPAAQEGGQGRPGFGPRAGFGTEVTGDAAQKVQQAVAAEYDGGIERVQQLSDGSYLAHVITSDGEIYVSVSKSFEITGTQQRAQGAMPPGSALPGSQSGAGTTTS